MKVLQRVLQATSRSSHAVLCLVVATVLMVPSVAHAGRRLYGITTDNHLVSFDSKAPGKLLRRPIPIQFLTGQGDHILGIDFRPATGQLFGIGSSSVLYTINPNSGVATPVGPRFSPRLDGSSFGFDFNPVVDRVRVVSNNDQNLRLDPTQGVGQVVDFDPNKQGIQPDAELHYGITDPNRGIDPVVVGSAYTNPDRNPQTGTILYGIDARLNTLVMQGGPNGTPSPNLGDLFTVGPLGVNTAQAVGFDISKPGTAFAALRPFGQAISVLYTINLNTGKATKVGNIGTGKQFRTRQGRRVSRVLRGFAAFIGPPPQQTITDADISDDTPIETPHEAFDDDTAEAEIMDDSSD